MITAITAGRHIGKMMKTKHVDNVSISREATIDGVRKDEVAVKVEFTDGTTVLSVIR